jgi:hypothetical protein
MSDTHPICKFCGGRHRIGPKFCPELQTKSGGGVEGHAAEKKGRSLIPATDLGSRAEARAAGIKPGPPDTKRKAGRPRLGETRSQPWIEAKMSRSTWYRRQAEKRKS